MTAATKPVLQGATIPTTPKGRIAPGAVAKRGWLAGRITAGANKGLLAQIGFSPNMIGAGVFDQDYDNSAAVVAGPSVICGEQLWAAYCTTSLTIAVEGALIYGVDNQTFSVTDGGGVYPPLGLIYEVREDGSTTYKHVIAVGPNAIARAKAAALSTSGSIFYARNVVFNNVADLTAYTVAASTSLNDNVLNVAGDVVLLANQTTTTQNGLYVVGTVASGTAPLTRLAAMPLGAVFADGVDVVLGGAGGVYANTRWFAARSGGFTVGTHDPDFVPESYKQTVTLASGTYKVGFGSTANPDEPFFSRTGMSVQATLNTPGGTLGTWGHGAPSASRTTGRPGTGFIVINSYKEDGTVETADTSTVDVLVRYR